MANETSTELNTTRAVQLSLADWEEIAAAIGIRATQLGQQKDELLTKRERTKWINQLNKIGQIIGDDGKLAAQRGVAPAQK